jgi:methionine-rich copper-binding protein CopC
MRRTPIRDLRSVLLVPAVMVGLLTAMVLTAAPASAHDSLLESTPAEGAVVGVDGPKEASFRFNNEIFTEAAFIAVLDPSGTDVSTGEALVSGDTVSRGYAVTGPGTYTASYRVTSSDGHPIEGSVTFTYDGPAPATEDPADERAEAEPSLDAQTDASEPRNYTAVALTVVALAVLVVGTAVGLNVLRRRRQG